jgi:hypothetical protein
MEILKGAVIIQIGIMLTELKSRLQCLFMEGLVEICS